MGRVPRLIVLIAGLSAAAGFAWWQREALLALTQLAAPESDRPSEVATIRQRALRTFDQAQALFQQRRFDEARALYEGAAADYERAIDTYNQAVSLGNAGACESNLRRPAQALAYYTQALALFEARGEHAMRLDTHLSIASQLVSLGRAEEARPHLAQAWSIAGENLADPRRQAEVAVLQGKLEQIAGRTEAAVRHFEQALTRAEAADPEDVATAAMALAEIATRSGRTQAARATLARVLAQAQARGTQGAEAAALEALGRLALEAGQVAEARERFGSAARLYARLNRPERYAGALAGIAAAEIKAGELQRAGQTLRLALRTVEDAGAASDAARMSFALGDWALKAGQRDDAATWFEQARARFEALGETQNRQLADERLRGLAVESGDALQQR